MFGCTKTWLQLACRISHTSNFKKKCFYNTFYKSSFACSTQLPNFSTMSSPDLDERAILEFARITGVDEALAHFHLQDYDYDLQKGLNAYYRQLDGEMGTSSSAPPTEDKDSDVEVLETDMDVDVPPSEHQQVNADQFPKDITILSYNVDGIDSNNLNTRFKGVIRVIADQNPEVILLQEVVDDHMSVIIEVFAKMYHVIFPTDSGMPYFTVTMVSRNIKCRSKEVKTFANTSMGRTMTVFEGIWQKLRLVVVHSHLESMREFKEARQQQFGECMKKMEENLDPNTLVIFGGDLNIRDAELPVIHPQIKDAWIAAGSDANTRYTWDNKLNQNKGLPPNVRCRFDRVYFCGPYKKLDFFLAGNRQIRNILCHPSDHFAVVCKFYEPNN